MPNTNLPSQLNPITEQDIADFLVNTPDFFERHAELLSSVQLNSGHGKRAVSLQERQAEMLREKIKVLERGLMDMIRTAMKTRKQLTNYSAGRVNYCWQQMPVSCQS